MAAKNKAKAKKIKKPVSKAAIKNKKPASGKKEKPVGEIIHYYDHIKVAVIKCKESVCVGQELHIIGGEDTDFKQKVASMQFDHKGIKKAKKGQSVGIKVKEKVREGYKVFKA